MTFVLAEVSGNFPPAFTPRSPGVCLLTGLELCPAATLNHQCDGATGLESESLPGRSVMSSVRGSFMMVRRPRRRFQEMRKLHQITTLVLLEGHHSVPQLMLTSTMGQHCFSFRILRTCLLAVSMITTSLVGRLPYSKDRRCLCAMPGILGTRLWIRLKQAQGDPAG